MKVMQSVSPAVFEAFQQQNMDPALDLIGSSLTKLEKRKQVAARMLGFSAFEAIPFEDDLYSYTPKCGELLIARHPKMPHRIVLISDCSVVVIDENGDIYFPGGKEGEVRQLDENAAASKCVNDVTEDFLKTMNLSPRALQVPFETARIDIGFEGVKVYDIGVTRMSKRQIEFDVVARNGIVYPFIITASTTYSAKPTADLLKTSEVIDMTLHVPGGPKLEYNYVLSSDTTIQTINRRPSDITRDMVVWELQNMTFKQPWSTQMDMVAESLDCVRIAYAFLDAQPKNTKKMPNNGMRPSLSKAIRLWAGYQVSDADLKLAMKMHPEIQGDPSYNNLSSQIVFPCYSRLKNVPDAGTYQDYALSGFRAEQVLEMFESIETLEGSVGRSLLPRTKKDKKTMLMMTELQKKFFETRVSK